MILTTHTGDVNFNSFAAEVDVHADYLTHFLIGNIAYESVLRADLETIENAVNGLIDSYHDFDSEIVQEHSGIHGAY